MPTVHFPTPEQEDLHLRFTVTRHYLQAMRHFLNASYGHGQDLHIGLRDAVQTRQAWQHIQRSNTVELDEVRQYLVLGWTSEVQLQVPGVLGESAPIRFFNAWSPVHAYYAVYGILQAWFAANGISGVTDDHTAALKTIASMIRDRNLFPEPWGLLATGCPMREERSHINAPEEYDCTSHVEPLTIPMQIDSPAVFWPRYGMWLRSTRKARLIRREELWKKKNQKRRVSPKARADIAQALAPTSFFDCLWRMRIRANYGTVDPFVSADIPDAEHQQFHRALTVCIDATMGALELYVAQKIGREAYAGIAHDFVTNDAAGVLRDTLQVRLNAYGFQTPA